MRAIFQSGLRPAVARLYDPFDAMLARRGGARARAPSAGRDAPGLGGVALRAMLRRPGAMALAIFFPLCPATSLKT